MAVPRRARRARRAPLLRGDREVARQARARDRASPPPSASAPLIRSIAHRNAVLMQYKERPPGYTPAPPGPHGRGQAEAEAAALGAGARGGRPPIERYFVMPPHAQGRAHPQQQHHRQQQQQGQQLQGHGQGQGRKRGRSVVERGASPSAWRADKRAYVGAGGAA